MTMQNRIAVTTNTYHGKSLDEALEGIAAAGFRYVEFAAISGWSEHLTFDADAQTLDGIQRTLNRLDLIAISISGHTDLMTEEGLQCGLRLLDLGVRLGIDLMIVSVGGHDPLHEDVDKGFPNLLRLVDYAAERDITIGLAQHGNATATGPQTKAVIERVNRENIGICYDTANIEFLSESCAVVDLPQVLPLLVSCHLKDHVGGYMDWDFPALGEGQVDFKEILSMLERGGYAGPLVVEMEFQNTLEDTCRLPLEDINKAVEDSYTHLVSLGLAP